MARFQLEDGDYQRLLRLRTSLRQYLRRSEQQAQAVGLTPAHHQFLLAIRGHADPRGPTIGDVAGYLLLRHHSTVELAQRVGALGLIRRVEDPDDRRIVRLALTDKGAAALERLASQHLEELSRLAGDLQPYWLEHISGQPRGSDPADLRVSSACAGWCVDAIEGRAARRRCEATREPRAR